MPLTPALCTQCGARLEVNPESDATICRFCGTPFITEKAINKYNISVGSLRADVVNVQSADSADNLYRSGEVYVKMEKYLDAERAFEKMTEKYPYDYRGWFGCIIAATKNFASGKYNLRLNEVSEWSDWAIRTAPDEKKAELKSRIINYYSALATECDGTIRYYENNIRNNNAQIPRLRAERESLARMHRAELAQMDRKEKRILWYYGTNDDGRERAHKEKLKYPFYERYEFLEKKADELCKDSKFCAKQLEEKKELRSRIVEAAQRAAKN